ncbi:ABC transporter ATP-binding protein [Pullulanibacillus sp. KACC 23026]|uniref:ABC transporter ATP-binding protein n=1 Tax=Pullulanibacillus sp. KACC 23026 TaxID=3028315 RepID=UPI0023AFDAA6|nr:ABC transporter ATP-binding protein [Pullulanibacillus sp. KACC 23026]WEG14739.1 ABC transporter ATP-binding protein [Pullulanibacillus sp. KACC 23026]
MSEVVLELKNINKTYKKGKSSDPVRASQNVSIKLKKRQIISLVGESGSGKTTLARLITGVEKPDSGSIIFEGKTIKELSGSKWFDYRRKVQMIFQDPFSSINPLNTISYTLQRPLINYLGYTKRTVEKQVRELLDIVNLSPVDDYIGKLPFELSGGQLQRVGIARALASQPSLIIADEPVSMLDVSIRAEILHLLDHLRKNQGVSLIYITHDLVSARALADEIVVLYRGKVVEHGPSDEISRSPKHPYTELLLGSIADPWRKSEDIPPIELTNAPTPAAGCVFRNRCPHATEQCAKASPQLIEIESEHSVACFLHSEKEEELTGGELNGSIRN